MAILEVAQLEKSFGGTKVLRDISFSLEESPYLERSNAVVFGLFSTPCRAREAVIASTALCRPVPGFPRTAILPMGISLRKPATKGRRKASATAETNSFCPSTFRAVSSSAV